MLNSYNHIFIIPCSKKKIWTKGHIGPIEAKDAYISTYFRLCKEYVNKFLKKWFILSGKYGIISPDFIIMEDYDVKLKASKKFKEKVIKQVESIISEDPIEFVVSLCGDVYSNFLKEVFYPLGVGVKTPLKGMRIGERQRLLKSSLETGEELAL